MSSTIATSSSTDNNNKMMREETTTNTTISDSDKGSSSSSSSRNSGTTATHSCNSNSSRSSNNVSNSKNAPDMKGMTGGIPFGQSFYENAIERYRRNREEAASSSSFRAAMCHGAAAAAAANKSDPVISNTSTSHTSDDSSDPETTVITSSFHPTNHGNEKVKHEQEAKDQNNQQQQVASLKKESEDTAGNYININNNAKGDEKETSPCGHGYAARAAYSSEGQETKQLDEDQEDEDEDDIGDEAREAVGTLLELQDATAKATLSASLNSVGSNKRKFPSSSAKADNNKKASAPIKKRRYQKRGVAEDATPIEGMSELEKKRLASRISSRRTREREKMRGEYFRTIRKKLEKKNKKLREENAHIRTLIKNTKREVNAAKTSGTAATNTIQPLILNQILGKKTAGSIPSSEPVEVGSNTMGTSNALPTSSSSVPPPSASTSSTQDQLLIVLLQQLLAGNSSNGSNGQQSIISNPAVLAIIIAALQKQQNRNSNQPVSAELLLPLLQGLGQNQHQNDQQGSLLLQLLPILLAVQSNNNGSHSIGSQQGLAQLIPLLVGAGQNKGSTSQEEQRQTNSTVGGPANLLQQLLGSIQLNQIPDQGQEKQQTIYQLNQIAALLQNQGSLSGQNQTRNSLPVQSTSGSQFSGMVSSNGPPQLKQFPSGMAAMRSPEMKGSAGGSFASPNIQQQNHVKHQRHQQSANQNMPQASLPNFLSFQQSNNLNGPGMGRVNLGHSQSMSNRLHSQQSGHTSRDGGCDSMPSMFPVQSPQNNGLSTSVVPNAQQHLLAMMAAQRSHISSDNSKSAAPSSNSLGNTPAFSQQVPSLNNNVSQGNHSTSQQQPPMNQNLLQMQMKLQQLQAQQQQQRLQPQQQLGGNNPMSNQQNAGSQMNSSLNAGGQKQQHQAPFMFAGQRQQQQMQNPNVQNMNFNNPQVAQMQFAMRNGMQQMPFGQQRNSFQGGASGNTKPN